MKISLLQITFIISLIGIFLLLTISNLLQPNVISIDQITNKQLNKQIKISGQITNIKTYDKSNFQVITIQDKTGKIKATLNNPINITKNPNTTLEITGKVSEYKGELQIQANKILKNKEKKKFK